MIPDELEEVVALDGCLPSGCFWRILPPMARPVLGTVPVRAVAGSRRTFLLNMARSKYAQTRHQAGDVPALELLECLRSPSARWPNGG
ncbi:hypothetical protein OG467_46115 [Streptomyces sp. NBC_01361]|nr:hypothetical protein [Streptomyces sp. NBC_01361]